MISRDNVTTLYGLTAEARVADPGDPSRVFSWLISESYDDRGNAILYRYKAEDSTGIDVSVAHELNRTATSRAAQRYLKSIKYGNRTPRQPGEDLTKRHDWLFEVVLDYGEHYTEGLDGPTFVSLADTTRPWTKRADPFSSYRSGFEVRTYRLCRRVLCFHHLPDDLQTADYLVRATHLSYSETPVVSYVTSITQSGYTRREDGTYLERSFPPLELEYTLATLHTTVLELDEESLENLPAGVEGSDYSWIDLDGDGVAGVLAEQRDGWLYKRNLSPLGNGTDARPLASRVKASDHGLGHLLDPTHVELEHDEDEEDAERFTQDLWQWILSKEFGFPVTDPEWFDLPAVGRVSLSSLNAMIPFAEYNRRRAYPEQIKPHGFAVCCYVKEAGLPPDVEDPEHFHLVGPFEQDPTKWLRLPWFDLYSGSRYRIRTGNTARAYGNWCVVKSYREVLEDYRIHAETKLAGADGLPCSEQTVGLLHRRSVLVAGTTHIGKETNELEARVAGTVHALDEVMLELGDPEGGLDDLVRAVLRSLGAAQVARRLSIDRVSIWRFLARGVSARVNHRTAYVSLALAHARSEFRHRVIRAPKDEADVLALYLAIKRDLNEEGDTDVG